MQQAQQKPLQRPPMQQHVEQAPNREKVEEMKVRRRLQDKYNLSFNWYPNQTPKVERTNAGKLGESEVKR